MNVDLPTPVSPNSNTLISVFEGDDFCDGIEDADGDCFCGTGGKGCANYRDKYLIIFTFE